MKPLRIGDERIQRILISVHIKTTLSGRIQLESRTGGLRDRSPPLDNGQQFSMHGKRIEPVHAVVHLSAIECHDHECDRRKRGGSRGRRRPGRVIVEGERQKGCLECT